MATRVMVFAKINRRDEAAYAEVTAKVKGTDGHIADELLRQSAPPDPDDGTRTCILLSEWASQRPISPGVRRGSQIALAR